MGNGIEIKRYLTQALTEVAGHVTGALSTLQVDNTLISNIGQGANNINKTLPAPAAGLAFAAYVGEPSANYWRFTAAAAGTIIADGVVNKDYVQFGTPTIGDFFTARSVKAAPQPSGMLTGAALAIGGTTTAVATGAFTFYIAGTKYSKSAVAAGTAPGNDVIPQNKFGAVALDIGADGTLDAVEATGNEAGTYTSAAAAVAGLPAVEAAHVRVGYVTAKSTDVAGFTFGTTALNAANTTVAYTSTAAYTVVYNWVIETGNGTLTAG